MPRRERTNQREIQLELIHRLISRSFCTGSQSPIWWQRLDFDSLIPLRHVRILESFPAICIVHDRIIYVFTRKSGWMILKISFPLVEEDSTTSLEDFRILLLEKLESAPIDFDFGGEFHFLFSALFFFVSSSPLYVAARCCTTRAFRQSDTFDE